MRQLFTFPSIKLTMSNSFFYYLKQLEMMAFFSGYPFIYLLVLLIMGNKKPLSYFKNKMGIALPLGYALIGTLYLGLQLKNAYFSYSVGNLKLVLNYPYFIIWGILAVLFWIPVSRKNRALSLLHSLVFFFFLARDIFNNISGASQAKEMLQNDMRIYTVSLILNAGAFIIMLLLSLLFSAPPKKLAGR